MADESDGAAVEKPRQDPDRTTCALSSDDEEEEDGFTFVSARRLPVGGAFGDGGVIGHVYPVFGRPRSPPVTQPDENDAGTATVRVPLRQLLLAERASSSSSTQEPDDDDDGVGDGELDGVPAKTTRCRKSGSTGSIFRWRQRLSGRSHSDGKEKYVFLDAAGPCERKGKSGVAGKGGNAWSYYAKAGAGVNGRRRSSFLPYRQDLVGLFANATAFRRSYHPF